MTSSPAANAARSGVFVVAFLASWAFLGDAPALAQTRILVQDPALDNLATPPDYATVELGTLGAVHRSGTGPVPMILIPGLGFGGGIFEPLTDAFADSHTTWSVTVPGFGGTNAPPTPPEGTSFREQTWTNATLHALEALMIEHDMRDAVVVGHWLTGTQLALRLANAQPERVRAVVLLAGSARLLPSIRPLPPLEERIAYIDTMLAPRWFRTVTRETWDDNNFLPQDYAVNPVLGLRHWREAARPPLHVWIRYMCEFYAQDVLTELPRVSAPVLLLSPGLDGWWHDPANPYLATYTAASWGDVTESRVSARTIPNTRVIMWADELDRVAEEVRAFLR